MYTVKEAIIKSDIERILALRYKLLREPWQQPIETATDTLEFESVNAFIENDLGTIVACGRLQENENKVGQIRFMAVREDFQGKGMGKEILNYLEEKAKEKQFKKIELQARENAKSFYESNGYHLKEKSFKLWDKIQHYLMEKVL